MATTETSKGDTFAKWWAALSTGLTNWLQQTRTFESVVHELENGLTDKSIVLNQAGAPHEEKFVPPPTPWPIAVTLILGMAIVVLGALAGYLLWIGISMDVPR